MINGQFNMVSMPTATQSVTQESAVQAATAMDGGPQNGGDFAELLSGIRLKTKGTNLPDSGLAEHLLTGIGRHRLSLDASEEEPADELPAQLDAPSGITTALASDSQKPEDSEKTGLSADAVLPGSEPSDITSQMVLAAYSQPGRMPDVSIPEQTSVDRLQKTATVTEQPAVISALPVEKRAEQVAPEPLPAAPAMPAEEQPKKTAAPLAQEYAEPLLLSDVAATVPPTASLQAKPDRTSEVDIPVQIPVDRLQNVATATVAISEILATAQVPDELIVSPEVKTADSSAIPAEREAVSVTAESVRSVFQPNATAPVPSPEAEVEIQLSQPRPITARSTAAPVVADNRSVVLVQETFGARQRFNPGQPLDKAHEGNGQSSSTETVSSIQAAASAGESSQGSDASLCNSNQGQPDAATDSQALAQQNVTGQFKTEHQKDAALSAKALPAEPVRQEIPEQVLQQVKERLGQHDVKSGSQQITLTLSPDSLGELKMNLNLQGQKLSVEIVTENRSVRDVIAQHTEALKESLARQNITMESFDVTTGGKGSGSQGQNQSAWRELAKQQQQQQFWTSPPGYRTAQADLPSGQAYQRQQGHSMLDIHY